MTPAGLAPAALVGATVAVSVSAVVIREAHSDAGTVVWLRMTIAVLLLAPWAAPQLVGRTIASTRRDALVVAAAGLFLAVHFLAWTASLAYTSVAASVLLVSLHPLLVAPISARLHGDSIGVVMLTGIAVALGGTVVTCVGALGGGSSPLLGDVLALTGAVALAGYLLIGRSRRDRAGVAGYSAAVYLVVAVAAVVVTAVQGWHGPGGLHPPTLRALVSCAVLALVCTVGGHTVFNWTLRRVPAAVVSLAFLAEAPLASVVALIVLGQRPDTATIAGGVLILIGLATFVRGGRSTWAGGGAAAGHAPPRP